MNEHMLKDFLESVPPSSTVTVPDFAVRRDGSLYVAAPDLHLHCPTKECEGIRFYEANVNAWLTADKYNSNYLTYVCRNCGKSVKTFAIGSRFDKDSKKWEVMKYGEAPGFGPPTPAKAITLIGGERELFLKGRRCEIQGLGVGAFVYYRRVIESQKDRIFDELIRVIGKISPGDAVLPELEAAKSETQFTKAVEAIKHALPTSLHLNGHNPLTLLHSALSEGVHEHTDDACLELASSVRTVLFEFAERLGQLLKEEANLNAAVSRLAKKIG